MDKETVKLHELWHIYHTPRTSNGGRLTPAGSGRWKVSGVIHCPGGMIEVGHSGDFFLLKVPSHKAWMGRGQPFETQATYYLIMDHRGVEYGKCKAGNRWREAVRAGMQLMEDLASRPLARKVEEVR